MTNPVVTLGTARTAAQLSDEICALYQAVFSQAPFAWNDQEAAAQRHRLERLSGDPTFGISIAEVQREVIGFAYGVSLRPDTQWWSHATVQLPGELTAEWNMRTFAIIDLAVSERHRRRGIGRALLDALLKSRREERATLTVQPVATNTKEFYEHLGWQKVGSTAAASGAVAPYFDLYLKPLHVNP
jgi:ribosomal protein S18 acetylase RimI-like enzyme